MPVNKSRLIRFKGCLFGGSIPSLIKKEVPVQQNSFFHWNKNKAPECHCKSIALFINDFILTNKNIFFSGLADILQARMRIDTYRSCIELKHYFHSNAKLCKTLNDFMMDLEEEFQNRTTITSDLKALEQEVNNQQQIVTTIKVAASEKAKLKAQRKFNKATKQAEAIGQQIIKKAQEEADDIRRKAREELNLLTEQIRQTELMLENREKEKTFLIQIPGCKSNLKKIWSDDKYKELVFCCKEGKEVYAHRMIFSENHWFNNSMRFSSQPLGKLKCTDGIIREMIEINTEEGYSKEAVETVLSYRYGLETFRELSYPLLEEVWNFANYVRFEDLVEECETLLIETIHLSQDALDWLERAISPKLKQHIHDIIAENFADVIKQEIWPKLLSPLTFANILENTHLSIPEKEFCEAIIEWALYRTYNHKIRRFDYPAAKKLMTEIISNEKPYNFIDLVNFDHLPASEFEKIHDHYDFFLPKPTLAECIKYREEVIELVGSSFPPSRRQSWRLVQESPHIAQLCFASSISHLEKKNDFVSPCFFLNSPYPLQLKMIWNEVNHSYDMIIEDANPNPDVYNIITATLSFEQQLQGFTLGEGSRDFYSFHRKNISKNGGWTLEEIKERVSYNRFVFTITFIFDEAKANERRDLSLREEELWIELLHVMPYS